MKLKLYYLFYSLGQKVDPFISLNRQHFSLFDKRQISKFKKHLTKAPCLLFRETVLRSISERAFLRTLEGGCSVPVAVTSAVTSTGLSLTGGVWSLDGTESLCSSKTVEFLSTGSLPKQDKHLTAYVGIVAENVEEHELEAAEHCGRELAELLIQQGAERILKQAKAANGK